MKKIMLLGLLLVLSALLIMGCSDDDDNSTEPNTGAADLVINEIMTNNVSFNADENDEYDNWVELYNAGGEAINIAGMYLSKDTAGTESVMIPDTDEAITTLDGGEMIVFWLDNQSTQGITHLDGLELTPDAGMLYILDADGTTVVDTVAYMSLAANTSYGRIPDGDENWAVFGPNAEYDPTPNGSNGSIDSIIYAYGLEQFIPKDTFGDMIIHDDEDDYEWRDLFYFWPLADDGFSPRVRGYDDMCWQDWLQGFYIPEDDNKVFFPQFAAQNIGAYNVKYMANTCVYRGVKAVITDTLSVLYELNGMETEQIENYDETLETAIKLSNFIPPHFTQVDSVEFVAVDGWTQTYSPEEVNDGYWLVDSQKTIFPGFPGMSGMKKKFKLLMEIHVYGEWQNVDDFINEALADENSSDWNLEFPEDLSDYIGEVWN